MSSGAHPGYTGSAARLLEEAEALRERHPEIRKLSPDLGAPVFELVVRVADVEHHLRLTLPPGYPRIPPEVKEIREPGGAIVLPHPGHGGCWTDSCACTPMAATPTPGGRNDGPWTPWRRPRTSW